MGYCSFGWAAQWSGETLCQQRREEQTGSHHKDSLSYTG